MQIPSHTRITLSPAPPGCGKLEVMSSRLEPQLRTSRGDLRLGNKEIGRSQFS